MQQIRPPAVAGQFYPGSVPALRRAVQDYIERASEPSGTPPKAIVGPHAGYIYSGPIAGSAYAYLAKANGAVKRVILIGPAHWSPVHGLAASSAQAFASPLGTIPVDRQSVDIALEFSQVQIKDEAHVREHCLEVHLPFLQAIFRDFSIVPLLVGSCPPDQVAQILEALWGGPETVLIISSDLSHYHDYETAVKLDTATSRAIEHLEFVEEGQACGRVAINGLLALAKKHQLQVETVDLRNSGDTAGPRDRVVGYGAYVFRE